MMKRTIRLSLALIALGGLGPQAAAAQDTNTVGPPVLRDFSIEGEQTVAPPPQEEPAPAPPAEEPAADETAPADTNAAAPEATPEAPAAEEALPTPGRTFRAPVATTTQTAPAPTAQTPLQGSLPVPVTADVQANGQQGVEPAPPPSETSPWLYALLGAGGGMLALLGVLALRERASRRPKRLPAPVEEAYQPEPAPVVPDEELELSVPSGPRPWIELEFKPAKAAATEAQAALEYELRIRNIGDADADEVRIEARMFNAGQQQDSEIGAFFSSPNREQATPAPRAIPPKGVASYKSVVALPKEHVREVVVQGRRLFIPIVAFNVLYQWGEGQWGQTSISYLVGRESEPPKEKMAPFRLDLGPRVYRSVGSRPSKLALSV